MKKTLLIVGIMSLFLMWCGKSDVTEEGVVKEEITTQEEVSDESNNESSFDMSDCMKWCEMLWNKKTSRTQMEKDCSALCEAWNAIETKNANDCEKSEGIMKDSCYSSIANDTKNPDLCKKITDGMMRYACYVSIAEETKDISLCEKIEDSLFKATCEQTVKWE